MISSGSHYSLQVNKIIFFQYRHFLVRKMLSPKKKKKKNRSVMKIKKKMLSVSEFDFQDSLKKKKTTFSICSLNLIRDIYARGNGIVMIVF